MAAIVSLGLLFPGADSDTLYDVDCEVIPELPLDPAEAAGLDMDVTYSGDSHLCQRLCSPDSCGELDGSSG